MSPTSTLTRPFRKVTLEVTRLISLSEARGSNRCGKKLTCSSDAVVCHDSTSLRPAVIQAAPRDRPRSAADPVEWADRVAGPVAEGRGDDALTWTDRLCLAAASRLL